LAVTTEGNALVLMVPFFGAVLVLTGEEVLVLVTAPAEEIATAEVDAGAEVAVAAGADVPGRVGGVIVTPFSAQSSTATWTAVLKSAASQAAWIAGVSPVRKLLSLHTHVISVPQPVVPMADTAGARAQVGRSLMETF